MSGKDYLIKYLSLDITYDELIDASLENNDINITHISDLVDEISLLKIVEAFKKVLNKSVDLDEAYIYIENIMPLLDEKIDIYEKKDIIFYFNYKLTLLSLFSFSNKIDDLLTSEPTDRILNYSENLSRLIEQQDFSINDIHCLIYSLTSDNEKFNSKDAMPFLYHILKKGLEQNDPISHVYYGLCSEYYFFCFRTDDPRQTAYDNFKIAIQNPETYSAYSLMGDLFLFNPFVDKKDFEKGMLYYSIGASCGDIRSGIRFCDALMDEGSEFKNKSQAFYMLSDIYFSLEDDYREDEFCDYFEDVLYRLGKMFLDDELRDHISEKMSLTRTQQDRKALSLLDKAQYVYKRKKPRYRKSFNFFNLNNFNEDLENQISILEKRFNVNPKDQFNKIDDSYLFFNINEDYEVHRVIFKYSKLDSLMELCLMYEENRLICDSDIRYCKRTKKVYLNFDSVIFEIVPNSMRFSYDCFRYEKNNYIFYKKNKVVCSFKFKNCYFLKPTSSKNKF